MSNFKEAFTNKIPLPRELGAILGALNWAFPERMSFQKNCESFKNLNALLPPLISVNDYCDLGLASKKQRKKAVNQEQFRNLLEFEMYLKNRADYSIDSLNSPELKNILSSFANDLHILTQNKTSYRFPQVSQFYELDSAIFEVACYASTIPELLVEQKIDWLRQCFSLEDVQDKYSFFTNWLSQTKDGNQILGLHAVEMLLKLDGDNSEIKEDGLFGLPNIYGDLQDKDEIKKIRQKYYISALNAGFSRITLNALKSLFTISHGIKKHRACNTIGHVDPYTMRKLFMHSNANITLRDEIVSSGLLFDLFSK